VSDEAVITSDRPRFIATAQRKFGESCGQVTPFFEQVALLAMLSVRAV
jgi:hypothetical protein